MGNKHKQAGFFAHFQSLDRNNKMSSTVLVQLDIINRSSFFTKSKVIIQFNR